MLAKAGVAHVNSHLATAIRTSFVLVFTWGIALAAIRPDAILALSQRTWLLLALSGLATGLSWLCYFRALQLGQASQVAPIDKLSVVFVLLFAAWFLHEPLSLRSALGGLAIVAGAIALAWK